MMKSLRRSLLFSPAAATLNAQCIGLVTKTQATLTIKNTRQDQLITAITILEKSDQVRSHRQEIRTYDLLLDNRPSQTEWSPATDKQFPVRLSTPDTTVDCAVIYANGVTDGNHTLAHSLAALRRAQLRAVPDLEQFLNQLSHTATTSSAFRDGLIQYQSAYLRSVAALPQFEAAQAAQKGQAISHLIERLLQEQNSLVLEGVTSSALTNQRLQSKLSAIAAALRQTS